MALSEFDKKRLEKAISQFVEAHRPPPEIRAEVDLAFRLEGQSVELFEIRPAFLDPSKKVESFIAKATYVKKSDEWRVYWKRKDGRWHRYGPHPTASSIDEFLEVVEKDQCGCFFG